MTPKQERTRRNAALLEDMESLKKENREWLVLRLLDIKHQICWHNFLLADNLIDELLGAVAEE
jgi:hypothetical protein